VVNPPQTLWQQFQALWNTILSISGATLTILLYLWIRNLLSTHRHRFPFANNLRKALNLEYYDFNRWEGDAYKTKIGEFLLCLDTAHPNFYRQLSAEEQKSFAVCVGVVVLEQALVFPSTTPMALVGLLQFLTVGWSMRLDLMRFEEMKLEIATEAVKRWRDCEDATVKWPYCAPTKKDKFKAFCCAKPSRAGVFASSLKLSSGRAPSGFALAELKKYEGRSHDTKEETKVDKLEATMEAMSSKVDSMELSIAGSVMSAVQLSSERTALIERRVDALEKRSLHDGHKKAK
jgi:hypothetical protein